MTESARLRGLSLNDLATEMGGVMEGAPQWSVYAAEFKRREFALQRFSAGLAVCGVIVSAIAIVIGAISSVRTDQIVSDAAMARVSTPCRLPTLPKHRQVTNADLEIGYIQRGLAIVECDQTRQSAVEMIRLAPR